MQAEAAASLSASLGAERVVAALKSAAAATGSDFHYLLGTAMRESSLRPTAQSANSSAAGLFQFIDQTWLGLVKEHGAQHGLSNYAAAISKDSDGRFHADAGAKQSILALRKNPETAALMAGEYAKSTQGTMRASLGREVCGGELYAAHFLGPDAACKLIKAAGSDPGASAASLFPGAAAANKSVFFHDGGAPKSVREVYDWALKQPGGTGTLRMQDAGTPALTMDKARVTVATAQDAQVQMLLASVMNWQPKHSAFSSLFGTQDKTTPSSAMSFSPGLLGLLSDAKDSTS
jgi:hypothetical protein